jgi:hypothetical protein
MSCISALRSCSGKKARKTIITEKRDGEVTESFGRQPEYGWRKNLGKEKKKNDRISSPVHKKFKRGI